MAEELLRAEGFTDVQYLMFPEGGAGVTGRLGSGVIDMTQWYGASFVEEVDKGAPVVVLAGVHVGCQELFATDRVRTIADLRGKTIGIPWGTPQTWVIIAMLRNIGLDHPTGHCQLVAEPRSV